MVSEVTGFWSEIHLFPSSSVAPDKSPLLVPASPVVNTIPAAWHFHEDGCGAPSADDMHAVLSALPTLGCFVMAASCCNHLWQGL